MAFVINYNRCVGCGACYYVCLFKAPLKIEDGSGKYVIKNENCIGCGQCEEICPNNAISPAPGHRRIRRVEIDSSVCNGCGVCVHFCIAKAPLGERKQPHEIDQEKCFHCGLCASKCPKHAISVEYADA